MKGSSTSVSSGSKHPGRSDSSVGKAVRRVDHPGPTTMKPSGTVVDRGHGSKAGDHQTFKG